MRIRPFMLLVVMLISVGVWAQSDPTIGTWKLNLAKSKYDPGPPAKSLTLKITAVPGGIKVVSDGVNAQGQATHTEVTAMFDGKEYPRTAMAGGKPDATTYDSVMIKKIDAYNYDQTEKLKGQPFGVVHITISPDGKTRTTTGTGKTAQGQPTNNVLVWDKQ